MVDLVHTLLEMASVARVTPEFPPKIVFVIVSFPVGVGLRRGCVMSPWLFDVYIDGVVLDVNVGVVGRGWSC